MILMASIGLSGTLFYVGWNETEGWRGEREVGDLSDYTSILWVGPFG